MKGKRQDSPCLDILSVQFTKGHIYEIVMECSAVSHIAALYCMTGKGQECTVFVNEAHSCLFPCAGALLAV